MNVKGKLAPIPIWRVIGLRLEPEGAPLAPLVGRRASLSSSGRCGTRCARINGPISSRSSARRGSARAGSSGNWSRVSNGTGLPQGRCRQSGETTGYGAFGQQVFQLAGSSRPIRPTSPAPSSKRASPPCCRRRMRRGRGAPGDPARALGRRDARQAAPVLLGSAVHGSGLRARPTAFIFEDIHWAEPALLELLESLASRLTDVPVLLVTLARPDLLEDRRTWVAASLGTRRCTSSRWTTRTRTSSPTRCWRAPRRPRPTRIVRAYERRQPAVPGGARRIGHRAHRQPRRGAADDGAGDHRRTARRVPRRHRQVLQDAAVIGRVFWRGPIAAMQGDQGDLDAMLDDLARRDFIRRRAELERAQRSGVHLQTRAHTRGGLQDVAALPPGTSSNGRRVHRAGVG